MTVSLTKKNDIIVMISTFFISETTPASVKLEEFKSTVSQHFVATAGTSAKLALIEAGLIPIALD